MGTPRCGSNPSRPQLGERCTKVGVCAERAGGVEAVEEGQHVLDVPDSDGGAVAARGGDMSVHSNNVINPRRGGSVSTPVSHVERGEVSQELEDKKRKRKDIQQKKKSQSVSTSFTLLQKAPS